ncbi:phage tail assembly chaperone [Aquamicrobium sp. LC103]|uniref:phage tail assembly chaperone n=1 Tax=Aquamicrobium sp. LC103 TaxID=1120658 RepID=UPI000AD30CCF|nr:phage tail assembly chaperone [Aquamicrobium sp. LC103]
MSTGLGLMRLPPNIFWSMTPRELEFALGFHARAATGAPPRSEFEALMALFPDGSERI